MIVLTLYDGNDRIAVNPTHVSTMLPLYEDTATEVTIVSLPGRIRAKEKMDEVLRLMDTKISILAMQRLFQNMGDK